MPSTHEAVARLPYLERRVKISRLTPPIDRFLYKFRAIDIGDNQSIDRLRDIVVRSKLWLSAPSDFNDPFDMAAQIVVKGSARRRRSRFNKILKNQGIKSKQRVRMVSDFADTDPAELSAQLQSKYEIGVRKMGVYCFAGDPRNILMWSHYTQNHTGMCIQFEVARDFRTLSAALKAEYSTEYPEVDWTTDFGDQICTSLLRKHDGWSYEQERRIVRWDYAHKYLGFDPGALTGVILGSKIDEDQRRVVRKLLSERQSAGLPGVGVYEARLHEAQYQLLVNRSKRWLTSHSTRTL